MINPLVDEWVAAIGGMAAVARIRTIHTRGRICGLGLDGVIEEWATADGRHRQRLDLGGVFQTLRIYNSALETGWLVDQNGKLLVLSGDALRDEITETFVASYSHLVPGRMRGRVVALDAGPDNALRVEPEGGVPVTCHLDPTTYIPLRTEKPQAEMVRETRFDDWREVDGVLMPFRICQNTNGPESRIDTFIEDVKINTPFDDGLFTKPPESAPDFSFTEGADITEIPINLNWNHVYIEVSVNESDPMWMLLDTGAQISAIDTGCAEELGLESVGHFQGRGAGEGTTTAALAGGVSFRFHGVELSNQTVGIIPLARMISKFTGVTINGVLGYDFISRFVVGVNYRAKTMTLADPKSFRYDGDGDVIPISLSNGIPMALATIKPLGMEPITAAFLVDTGASDALYLSTPFVESHQLIATLTNTVRMTVPGVGGESSQNVGRVERLDLGQQVLANPVTFFSHDQRGAFANPGVAGVIGAEVLRRFNVVFDYSAQRVILEPNASVTEPFEFDRSGLVLQAGGPDYRTFSVRSVIAGSPAEEAGLHVGDIVCDINGSEASRFTLAEISRILTGDATRFSIRIRRGDEALDFQLALRRLV